MKKKIFILSIAIIVIHSYIGLWSYSFATDDESIIPVWSSNVSNSASSNNSR